MMGSCGVSFAGEIHFFGGYVSSFTDDKLYSNGAYTPISLDYEYRRQHFGFNKKGQLIQYNPLSQLFNFPQCIVYENEVGSKRTSSERILICFDLYHQNMCYEYYDENLIEFTTATRVQRKVFLSVVFL